MAAALTTGAAGSLLGGEGVLGLPGICGRVGGWGLLRLFWVVGLVFVRYGGKGRRNLGELVG